MLVIELDGNILNKPEVADRDTLRENDLVAWGYNIIRYSNKEVFEKVAGVVQSIRQKANEIIESNHKTK